MRTFMMMFALVAAFTLGTAEKAIPQNKPADSGINFFHGTWNEALAAAKKQKKLIFVDAYAVWCGPCKYMANNVFPDGGVGEFFNKNFISYKFDMEKGEGPQFANKYQITAYPTLLFIDHNGEVVYRQMGARDVAGFLRLGEEALAAKK